ncbi:DNA mismatch repair protein MutS [Arachidicoccus soli]|uniref:DNA mismatch repair protein MutS n=1 Tax=Arachidicoccus soli TaxID=2341117 RepID=A0A386HKV0_9BACT|nr:DNA mismatch repair protein MutS [Arachidicoccus soli]AYD46518.1 DNA mismatch repair protein MutS [Arachidicoccus soli]
MAKSSGVTPLMQQHKAIKQKYPDAILLFRVGDFYETFGNDAVKAAQVLGITLTKRNNGDPDAMELAGFPHHALDTYLHKLVKAGFRVAVCDQLEDPKQAKGIVKRGVTELVTPGVATSDKLLEYDTNNFLAAIHFADDILGIALLDISTGEFFLAEGNLEYIDKLIQTLKPAEVIFQRNQQKKFKEIFGTKIFTYTLESWIFEEAFAEESLLKHFQTHSLKGFGVENMHQGIVAAGAILYYLKETEHPNLKHISIIQRIERDEHLWMDRFTIRNLEILSNGSQDGNNLLKVLDNTSTPMGARLLKRWIVLPLKDLKKINERLDTVEFLILHSELKSSLQQLLKQCGDLERLASKISMKKVSPREVMQLAKSLQLCEQVKLLCAASGNEYLQRLADALNPCPYIVEKIMEEISDEPPAMVSKGNLIKEGVDKDLDELRNIAHNGKAYLQDLQRRETEKTGISSLKIGFNNVFGYYLEVTNLHKEKVPQEWIRKQTLTNAERYITEELKQYEEKITGAEDKILSIETNLYEQLLDELIDYIAPIQVNGNALAILDCLHCFAQNAQQYNYRKPFLHEGFDMQLKESRHPVIERNLSAGEAYIANDILLNSEEEQIIILTGPNMSGKSALLRQTALITLMAHMGSFVPSIEARIPLTDKIFTRVGASDNLSGGESTFMVEMNETASIINNVSPRSLILLDEIGRGTSTYDGISIAWSIVEFLHNSSCKPKTLFATHYHELNDLEKRLNGVKNYHITNKEVGNKVIFLRKLARGGSTHSFGIHVAKMAGMPPDLINRANDILKQLEEKHDESDENAGPGKKQLKSKIKDINAPQLQLSIFDVQTEVFEEIRSALENIDINRLTPVEALMKLNEIKGLLK